MAEFSVVAILATIAVVLIVMPLTIRQLARQRFRVHMSTAVILMIVAGCLIWFNTEVARVHYDTNTVWLDADQLNSMQNSLLVMSIIFSVAILFVVWLVCEWFIARNARHG